MPKITVYEHRDLLTGKDDVGCAGEPARMLAEPEAYRVQGTSYGNLDPGVLVPDACHQAATLNGCQAIGHPLFPVRGHASRPLIRNLRAQALTLTCA